MIRHISLAIVLATVIPVGFAPAESSWLFNRSYYSHATETGQRVAQYAAGETPYVQLAANYMQSGYRQNRLSIRVGGSADHLHIVETWGEGEHIRPYGEWQRPYRDGATPFGPWGNQRGPWSSPFGGGWVQQGFGQGFGGLPNYWYQGPFLRQPAPAPPPPVPGP